MGLPIGSSKLEQTNILLRFLRSLPLPGGCDIYPAIGLVGLRNRRNSIALFTENAIDDLQSAERYISISDESHGGFHRDAAIDAAKSIDNGHLRIPLSSRSGAILRRDKIGQGGVLAVYQNATLILCPRIRDSFEGREILLRHPRFVFRKYFRLDRLDAIEHRLRVHDAKSIRPLGVREHHHVSGDGG